MSGDLGHFVSQYKLGWQADSDRPAASILDVVYDWKEYYDRIIRPLAGFTKTSVDQNIVRGWRVSRNTEGMVELRYKVDPALNEHWRGTDGLPTSSGLIFYF